MHVKYNESKTLKQTKMIGQPTSIQPFDFFQFSVSGYVASRKFARGYDVICNLRHTKGDHTQCARCVTACPSDIIYLFR